MRAGRSALPLFAALALAALSACASRPFPLTPFTAEPGAQAVGDFDGDGREDLAVMELNADGFLVVVVRRAAAPHEPDVIWGGEPSSRPYFRISAAAPGRYTTACQVYDAGCGGVPAEVALTHEAIIIDATAEPARYLYYWDGAAFQNIIINE